MSEARAIELYDAWVLKKGDKVYLPQPFHKCSESCKLIEVRGFTPPHYVCTSSRKVHVCGERCAYTDRNNVCVLTALVKSRALEYNPTVSAKNPRVMINELGCYMKGTKRRERRATVPTEQRRVSQVRAHITEVMCGQRRWKMYRTSVDRYRSELEARLRKQIGATTTMDEIHGIAYDLAATKGRTLIEPLMTLDDAYLTKLAYDIVRYADKIMTLSPILKHLCSNIGVFTAMIMRKLCTGWDLDGVPFVVAEEPFISHAPADTQYGEFPHIVNGQISRLALRLQAECLTKSGKPKLTMRFTRS